MLASNLPLALAEMLVAVQLERIEIHGDRDHAYINSFTASPPTLRHAQIM